MPTPTEHRSKAGQRSWKVRFRAAGRNTSETFYTRSEAAGFARLIEAVGGDAARAQLRADRAASDVPTLDDWAERHFASLSAVTPGTLVTYRRIYKARWSPTLGRMRLTELTREAIAKALAGQTGSDKTIRNAWGVLATMCKTAVADGHLTRSPCLGVRLPRATDHESTEHRYLTHDELQRLFAALPDYWRPLVWMLAGTGMRWGEAVALTVGDVDVAHKTVRVTKAAKWDPSKAAKVIGPTKTRKSRRTIALPDEVMPSLTPLMTGRSGAERLFVAPKGGDVRHRTFWSDVWRPACAKAGLEPAPRIHDIRHSHVAWLIAAGVPLPVIQARLGHEHITTTIDTYGHLLPDLQRAAAQAASVALGGVTAPVAAIER